MIITIDWNLFRIFFAISCGILLPFLFTYVDQQMWITIGTVVLLIGGFSLGE